ncbi:hypothetical protein [Maridesulfovibrio ferrireducens]|uniref:hypothetical protein n=1 Tax=Maridesulfovibrio ferrireducens TaxID=246191 RepID=UPI001A352CED|nr:hypothetical protein [Maridesulfovibrio ferrireducens]MBI9112900.1 hypothetical protein [Maridesulfovibrio ferrireducens]
MFELEKASLFFETMASKNPTLVQNIEIVHENKTLLGSSYHSPKNFILNLNNLLRSLLFFVETSLQNTPKWLHDCIRSFQQDNHQDFEKLKKLRNVSAHQALIFPKESIVTGLFRIRSERDYTPKIGLGDLNKPMDYSWDLAMKNTDEIFHDLLVFHSMVFMDLEHSALWECLGVTRRWLYDLKYKYENNIFRETIDVYELTSNFSSSLLDAVCHSYAEYKKIKFESSFHYPVKEYNHVNTLLELDIYPSLFCEWWDQKIEPLNFGVRSNSLFGNSIKHFDQVHAHCYDNLSSSEEKYLSLLEKYKDTPTDEWLDENNINEFYSFIYFNHWHVKNSFKGNLLTTPVEPHEIAHLQRLGKIFLAENQKDKLCTIKATAINFKEYCGELIKKIKKSNHRA